MKKLFLIAVVALSLILLLSVALSAAPKKPPKPPLSWNFDDGSMAGLTVLTGDWSVVSQQLYVVEGPITQIDKIITQADPPANFTATVEMTHLSGYTSTGLLLRYQDAQHYYEIAFDSLANCCYQQPPRGIAIHKVTTSPTQLNSLGTWIQPDVGSPYIHLLAGRLFPFEFQLNHAYHLRAEVVNNTILVYVDNQFMVGVTDIDNPYTWGKAGLYSNETQATFDNFIIEPPACLP